MRSGSNDRRGRWVYQNLRWHYLHEEAARDVGAMDREEPAPMLSSLVDSHRLIDSVARWGEVSGCPVQVYGLDECEQLRMLAPGDSSPPEDELYRFAGLCLSEDRVLASGEGPAAALLAIPVRLEWRSLSRVQLVVVARLPEEIPGQRALRKQLIDVVDGYGAWVAQVLEQREELARLRAQNLSLMVRVESVEKRLLESCSAPQLRLDEGGTVFEDRILSQILALPTLGIVVERREDHRVLYMNDSLRRRFGDRVGEQCFRVFRGGDAPCSPEDCPLEALFREGAPPMLTHLAYDRENDLHYEVFALPLIGRDGSQQVMEVGVDVTRLIQRGSEVEEARERSEAGEPAK